MIVKIQPPNANPVASIQYNEKKMTGLLPEDIESGHTLATRNVPEGSTMAGEFQKLYENVLKKRRRGQKLRNLTFHMSVNPGEDDRQLSEDEVVSLVDEIMKEMGYSDQPYRIYAHTDIPRKHYHIVSCRAGRDGKTIDDSFERIKLRKILKPLAEKYGFDMLENEHERGEDLKPLKQKETKKNRPEKKKAESKEEKRQQKTPVRGFDHRNGTPVTEQMRNCIEDSMRWHFSTFEQYQHLMMRRYNLMVEIQASSDTIEISGTDRNGNIVTPFVTDEQLGIGLLKKIREKADAESMSKRREQKERLEKLSRAAAANSKTYEDFLRQMEERGVWVIPSWKKDSDEPFGLTYIDRATRCIWKGSETNTDLKWLKQTAETKGWTIEPDRRSRLMASRAEIPSRRKPVEKKIETKPAEKAGTTGKLKRIPTIKGGEKAKGSDRDVTKEKDKYLDDDDKERKHIEYI